MPLDYSLRSYLSVHFLDTDINLYIQSKKIEQVVWQKKLSSCYTCVCDLPAFHGLKFTIGYSEEEKLRGNSGCHLYWRKTLVETYKRVGCQMGRNNDALGVIGIFDVGENLEPKNTKQGFHSSNSKYKYLLKWLGEQIDSYWRNNKSLFEQKQPKPESEPEVISKPPILPLIKTKKRKST